MWVSGSSVFTGRKVPGPTWSVILASPIPRRSSASRVAGVKWRPAVGGGDGPRLLRIDGLVALAVLRGRRPLDVGRQGCFTDRPEQRLDRFVEAEPEAAARAFLDSGRRPAVQRDAGAPVHPPSRTQQAPPFGLRRALDQQDLDPAAGRPTRPESGGNDPGVVDHEQVARIEQVRQVAEGSFRRGAAHDEQATLTACSRVLGDRFRGQAVVEVGRLQAGHA